MKKSNIDRFKNIAIEVEKYEDNNKWTYEVFVDEDVELYLGNKSFDNLELLFSLIPNVEKVLHHDREIFLIKSTGWSASNLRERIAKIINNDMEKQDK